MSRLRIAIISPNGNAYSETFIAAHVQRLVGNKLVLTDGHLPRKGPDGDPLLDMSTMARVQRKITGRKHDEALQAAVSERLHNHRTQVILAEYGPTGAAMLPIAQELKVPLVVHFHGVDAFHNTILKEHRQSYSDMFQYAAEVIVVSREMEQQLLTLGCPREKLHYNCYGIDTKQFEACDPAKASKHFIGVGRFVDKKAPHLTILAFHQAWQQDKDVRLTLAGDGPLWDACKQLVGALGLEEAVDLSGVIPHDQVAERMGSSRAFVQHSVISTNNDHEGTPLAVLEALARGLPVIATRHAGIPDVIQHKVSGLLSDERDMDSMAQHMLRLATEPDQAQQMGQEGRKFITAELEQTDSIARLQNILEQAAAKP